MGHYCSRLQVAQVKILFFKIALMSANLVFSLQQKYYVVMMLLLFLTRSHLTLVSLFNRTDLLGYQKAYDVRYGCVYWLISVVSPIITFTGTKTYVLMKNIAIKVRQSALSK